MIVSSQRISPSWPPPTLDPAGPFAAPLSEISWVMLAMGVAVLTVVLAALALALGGGKAQAWIASHKLVVGAGFAFPVVVLSAALVYGLTTTARLSEPPQAGDLRIRISAEMWWWRVTYLDGERAFETANEIYIPVGEPVALELTSADVIHSFWAPQLAAKLDMIPGRTNVLRLQADRAGVYRGQCTEFCGAAHALMAFEIVAVDRAAFDAWRARQAMDTAPTFLARGREVFDAVGCGACHAIGGSPANGRTGPDLTHFGGRRTLAAGVLPNDQATLRRWIENADALKPGARMPSYERLSDADLDALTAYVASLQ